MTGKQVRQIRKNLELSQHGFANKIGCSQALVSNWEKEYTPVPDEYSEIIEELEEVSYNEAVK